jgi:hypothetical protein
LDLEKREWEESRWTPGGSIRLVASDVGRRGMAGGEVRGSCLWVQMWISPSLSIVPLVVRSLRSPAVMLQVLFVSAPTFAATIPVTIHA